MRKKEKEIEDLETIEEIIRRSPVCRLGMCDGDSPYVVPVNFGYRERKIFIHSALEGRKIDVLRRNSRVCAVFETDCEVLPARDACDWSVRYRCVIAFGTAVLVSDPLQKRAGLDVLMAHYARGRFDYPDEKLERTAMIRVDVEEMTGKQSGW
ncbi:MAG: pyridoxamine 5'-phosphate oxidase family protein [Desulfobacteraceae bacterium]|nr:pyridoxamine 5'-phosphate oxidase family protein [Desulfobacteraceae bacterium]